jgi:hypothetical protein
MRHSARFFCTAVRFGGVSHPLCGEGWLGTSPQIFSVNHRHRQRIQIKIIQHMCVDRHARVCKVRLALGPVRRFRKCRAAASRAEVVFYGLGAPCVGGDVVLGGEQPELFNLVVGPQSRRAWRNKSRCSGSAFQVHVADFEFGFAAMAAAGNPHVCSLHDGRRDNAPFLLTTWCQEACFSEQISGLAFPSPPCGGRVS